VAVKIHVPAMDSTYRQSFLAIARWWRQSSHRTFDPSQGSERDRSCCFRSRSRSPSNISNDRSKDLSKASPSGPERLSATSFRCRSTIRRPSSTCFLARAIASSRFPIVGTYRCSKGAGKNGMGRQQRPRYLAERSLRSLQAGGVQPLA